MDFTIEYRWTQRGVIPPRCRNPRDVTHVDTAVITVPEWSADEAPVAIERSDKDTDREHNAAPTKYRWRDGTLYVPWWPAVGTGTVTLKDPDYIEYGLNEQARYAYRYGSPEESVAALQAWADTHPFIDGVAHETTTEPYFKVIRYYYGGHDSVWVSVEDTRQPDKLSYSLLQWDEAHACAVKIGQSKDFEDGPNPIKVLIPAAIQRDPQGEAHQFSLDLARESAVASLDKAVSEVDSLKDRYTHLLTLDPEVAGDRDLIFNVLADLRRLQAKVTPEDVLV